MSYETIGSFDPAITNQFGYSGLIQFSPDNQRTYGVNANSTFEEQAQAAAQYLIDRGVRPGDGMSRIYAAILIGNADGLGPQGQNYMDAIDAYGNSVNSALKDLLPGGGHYQNGCESCGAINATVQRESSVYSFVMPQARAETPQNRAATGPEAVVERRSRSSRNCGSRGRGQGGIGAQIQQALSV